MRKDLEEHATREADAGVRQQLVDQIASANPFDVPPSWVSQLIDGYMQAYQVPEEERDEFRAEFRPVAERQVRRDLIIDTIAEQERLKATEADIDDRVAEVAEQARRRSGTGLRVAAEGRTAARDRAEHHRRESLRLADGTKRSRKLTQLDTILVPA